MAIKSVDKAKKVYFYNSPVPAVIDKKCPLGFVVFRFEKGFDVPFSKYISQSKDEKDDTTRANFNDRYFTATDTNTSSRVMTNWAKFDVLPEGLKVGNRWKKFSLVELVWVRAIHGMREFGLSLKEIAVVRSWVMEWDKKNKDYPWFEYYVMRAYVTSDDPYIVILPGGVAEIATASDVDNFIRAGGSSNMLLVSLKLLINELGLGLTAAKPYVPKVAPKEQEVLDEIRGQGNDEVKVKVKKGVITEIETAMTISGHDAHSFTDKEMRESGAYGQIVKQFEKGALKSVRSVRKKRFDK